MPTALPSLQGCTGKPETHDCVHCAERSGHRRKHWYDSLADSVDLMSGVMDVCPAVCSLNHANTPA